MAALSRARKVAIEMDTFSGLGVGIRNHSDDPFYKLTLEDVVRDDRPSWTWQLNTHVGGGLTMGATLQGQEYRSFAVQLLNEDAEVQPGDLAASTTVTITYQDVTGQTWRRTSDGDPEPIEAT